MIDEKRLDNDDDALDVGVPTMLLFFSIYTARRGSVRVPTMLLFFPSSCAHRSNE